VSRYADKRVASWFLPSCSGRDGVFFEGKKQRAVDLWGLFRALRLRKEEGMKTFEELKAVLTQDLLALERLARNWSGTIEQRDVKEQEVGRHCYEAEEDLSPLELNILKRVLGITDTKWRVYKAKFIEGSSPGELT